MLNKGENYMAKIHDRCKLCGAMKFLNYIGLCKRCNQSPDAIKIINKAVAERQERLDEEAADAAKEARHDAQVERKEAANAPAVEAPAKGEGEKKDEK